MKATDRQGMKNLLGSLISQEREHEKQLGEVLEDPLTEEAFENAPGDIDSSQFASKTEFSKTMSYNDLLNMIIEKEEKSAELYSYIASLTDYDEIRYIFENLASEERKHKTWAVNRYELEMLSSF
jgi:rubrerythrin